jgi:NAD(P)-dependent dehydrogenase (short-subunit alcohol dehydrogenase family)
MFTIDLAGTGVTVNALHPATYMDTAMVRRAAAQAYDPEARRQLRTLSQDLCAGFCVARVSPG